ncbi:hypothetical protein AAJ62_gp020 [Synechococcus phage ACG-2014g]|jgi:hypothetical protein|uniref:Uncharacterized protein n=1 Tax=Synechococcus phage ACG-2014g TaxID=1493512 RepID=A0A0E3FDE8_9CAUD|nr:hypothetical protein AAJ62_gp020 [Synechococcus phage ACG-2014g]AIX24364.1 hypothetical protein Syn7803US105_20 [Synechococcus phage ACG-2014g]
MNVKELPDGKLEIEWDENDPIESVLNNWTEEDFKNFFDECLRRDSGEFEKESGETGISEATQEDIEDFWYNELLQEDDITKEGC